MPTTSGESAPADTTDHLLEERRTFPPSEQFAAQAVFPFLPWAVAIVLLRRYGSRTLTGPAPTPTTQEQRS